MALVQVFISFFVCFLFKLFPQKADGLPVHLKRGVPDKLLYRTTMALTIGGTIYCLVALYMASQPRNQK